MRSIRQSFSVSFQYEVHFTKQVFSPRNTLFKDVIEQSGTLPKVLFVIDQGVVQAHPDLQSQIQKYSQVHAQSFQLVHKPLVLPGGEPCKNDPRHVDQILTAINEQGIDRHSYVAAIGGGALLDVVGYAASIGHRGVRHIRIPTTVLSQNDSGVGVKNGINAFGKKNFIGTFSVPTAVINDAEFLSTLELRDWRSGIAEAVKVSLIKDAAFFEFLEQSSDRLMNRDMNCMEKVIFRCAEMHISHIAGGDPFEQGSSRPLDFGHWSAHKLEQLTNNKVRHGEAVAIGMALDSVYSYLSHRLSQKELEAILVLLKQLGFELYHPTLRDKQLLEGLREFREHLGGELTIMLLEKIGKGVEVHHMDINTIQDSIDLLQQYQTHSSLSA